MWLLPSRPQLLPWIVLILYIFLGFLNYSDNLPNPSSNPLFYFFSAHAPWIILSIYTCKGLSQQKWTISLNEWSSRTSIYPLFWIPLYLIYKTEPTQLVLLLAMLSFLQSIFQILLPLLHGFFTASAFKYFLWLFHLSGLGFFALLTLEVIRPQIILGWALPPPMGAYFNIFPFFWLPYLWIPLGLYLHTLALFFLYSLNGSPKH